MKKKQNIILENGEHIDVVGPWTLAWRRFKANRIAMAGLIIFLVILVSVILVPIILGIDVNDYDLSINKYKTVEYVVEEYLSTDEIMTKIENIEQEIILGLAELRAML